MKIDTSGKNEIFEHKNHEFRANFCFLILFFFHLLNQVVTAMVPIISNKHELLFQIYFGDTFFVFLDNYSRSKTIIIFTNSVKKLVRFEKK